MYKVINIKWETDGYEVDLPNEVDIPGRFIDKDGVDEESVADWLFYTFEYVHDGFEIVGEVKNGGNIMSKKYYPIEDAVNNVSQKFKLGLKDANEMDEDEFNNVEEYILKYVKFVSHPDYVQLIPQSLETGEYIL